MLGCLSPRFLLWAPVFSNKLLYCKAQFLGESQSFGRSGSANDFKLRLTDTLSDRHDNRNVAFRKLMTTLVRIDC